jgi:hypothetical protein
MESWLGMEAIRREIQVIGDTETQPKWYKVFKIGALIALSVTVLILFGFYAMITFLLSLVFAGCVVHFTYRFKTESWTKSWGGWVHESDAAGGRSRELPRSVYVVIVAIWASVFILSLYISNLLYT